MTKTDGNLKLFPWLTFDKTMTCREADLCAFFPSLLHNYTIPYNSLQVNCFLEAPALPQTQREISFMVKNIERKKPWHAFQEHFRGWLKQNTIKMENPTLNT